MPNFPARAHDVLDYWTSLGPEGWYAGGEALDAEIRSLFENDWNAASVGGLSDWRSCARGTLAYIVLTDQFPRNMFRGTAKAFATDERARTAAMRTWQHQLDLQVPEPMRQFFYMPLMHAENTFDQDRSICLIKSRMPRTGAENLVHARAHREVIRRFGRFPFRNAALGRQSTPAEQQFLNEGGYGAQLRALGG